MKISIFLVIPAVVASLFAVSGCSSTDVSFSPDVQHDGGRANMSSNILSPQSGQIFPAGKDIPIKAVATDLGGVKQVLIMVNNKQIAKDTEPPYNAVLSKPIPGQYAIQSYATNQYGDNQLSSVVMITVK